MIENYAEAKEAVTIEISGESSRNGIINRCQPVFVLLIPLPPPPPNNKGPETRDKSWDQRPWGTCENIISRRTAYAGGNNGVIGTLGPAYNEQIDAKKTARCRGVLVVTELFNIAVNYFNAKKSTRCRRVLVVTEFVVSGTQCNLVGF